MRFNSENRNAWVLKLPVLLALVLLHVSISTNAQQTSNSRHALFDNDEVLELHLSGEVRELLRDKSDDMEYHSITLSYRNADSAKISIPIKVKTRGHFRRTQGNCRYPPLMLNFSKGDTPANSIFTNQDKLKLVTPCVDDKYVVYEHLVYKLYNLITEKSFRTRLVKVIYEDNGKESDPLYGILLEDEDEMARRNSAVILKGKLVRPEQTQRDDFFKLAVFEYLIANTDWSVQYYQNIKLISTDTLSLPSTVAYDFDHAGIVGAPYADPAQELMLRSVRERRYRGFCVTDISQFDETFALFNQKKQEIYEVYTKCALLDRGYVKSTVKFLDHFYETINDKKSIEREFGYPCRKNGTGNVVITGLKK
jgi:hypothetical protein